MGVSTIMENRQMLLLAFGTCRANAVAETAGLTRKPYYEWTWQQTPA